MFNLLFWIYLVNAILLIVHEMDSAYWKEWELFKIPGEITGFLLLHIPLLFILLYGMILLYKAILIGYIISIWISIAGIFAFYIHMYFIRKGRKEFNTIISKIILFSTLVVSIIQIFLTFYILSSK